MWTLAALSPILTLTIVFLAGAGPADDEDGPGPLPWRVGGPFAFTADAAAFPDSAGNSLEVYVRIPPSTLTRLTAERTDPARLSLAVRLRNRFGARQHEGVQEFAALAKDAEASFGKVVMMRFPVRPGSYRMQVRLEDPESRKRGLLYLGRRINNAASVEGELVVPDQQAGRQISDVEFVWSEAPASMAGTFTRRGAPHGSAGMLPNPERLYGLYANELRASFVAHAPQGGLRPWRWTARVVDTRGNVVAQRESTAAAGSWLFQTISLDVSTESSGGYDLEVKAWQEGDVGAMSRRAHFGIAWQRASWSRNPMDLEDDVHFLLEAEDDAAFSRMNPGEQERYLEDFWHLRDPTPDTAENEARTAFLGRIEHANRTWGRAAIGKGMFSDMGRAYIRHGEPDEILRQVMPAGDQTLSQVLQQLSLTETRPTGEVHQKGLGGDTRAFEIWIYEGDQEVSPTTQPATALVPRSRRRLLLLFVDEQGYGDYRLRYTTE